MTEKRLQEILATVNALEEYRGVSCGGAEVDELIAEVRNLGEHVERLQKEVAFWREKCENG